MLLRFLLLLALCGVLGCANQRPVVYQSRLAEVVRPSDQGDSFSAPVVTTQDDEGRDEYVFEDDLLRATWVPLTTAILYSIENRDNQSIKVLWNEAAFVDTKGLATRIMLEGQRFADRLATLPPSVVPRGGQITGTLVPSNRVRDTPTGWQVDSIIEPSNVPSNDATDALANVGETFSVTIPVEVRGVVQEYMFTFQVTSALVSTGRKRERGSVEADGGLSTPVIVSLSGLGILLAVLLVSVASRE
ncbi:MAG: hypothetical protein AAFX41_03085 [Bacteroidota bacterium]